MMKACVAMRRLGSLAALCIMGILAGAAAASAGAQDMSSERAMAVVGSKGLHAVELSVHGFKKLGTNRLVVPSNPAVYDVDGSTLTYAALKVPCRAVVEYRRYANKDPELFRIEVRAYQPKADSKFTLIEPSNPDNLPK